MDIFWNYTIQKYGWLMLGALTTESTFEIRVTSCRNILSCSLKIEKQIKALELSHTGCDVLATLPTGHGKCFEVFCLAKLFTLNPNASMISNYFAAQSPKHNSGNMN